MKQGFTYFFLLVFWSFLASSFVLVFPGMKDEIKFFVLTYMLIYLFLFFKKYKMAMQVHSAIAVIVLSITSSITYAMILIFSFQKPSSDEHEGMPIALMFIASVIGVVFSTLPIVFYFLGIRRSEKDIHSIMFGFITLCLLIFTLDLISPGWIHQHIFEY